MQIGYHYTTCESYDSVIVKEGLVLAPIHPRHYEEMGRVLDYIQEGAIWLYKLPQKERALIAMIIQVATAHGKEQVCLLRVEYEESQAASVLASRDLDDPSQKVILTHNLYAGPSGYFGHRQEPIELLNKPVLPEQIRLVNEWDLRDLLRRTEYSYV